MLLLLARTDPDKSLGHRGLSMFIAPKERGDSHGFELVQAAEDGAPGGGKMEGRPIDTIGYRGMHSYELSFQDWFVPAENLIGLVRSFVTVGIPFDLGALAEANRSLQETAANGTIGGLAMTSLALVAGVLGGFYDADNTPTGDGEADAKKRVAAGPDKARLPGKPATVEDDLDLEEDVPAPKKQAKR